MIHDIEIDRDKEYERLAKKYSKSSYEELVQFVQKGELSHLDFLIFQGDLFDKYVADTLAKEEKLSPETAKAWLKEYENKNIYEQATS